MRVLVILFMLVGVCYAGEPVLLVDWVGEQTISYLSDTNIIATYYMNGTTTEVNVSNGAGATLSETSGTIPTSTDVPSGFTGTSRDFERDDSEALTSTDSSYNVNGASAVISVGAWVKNESRDGSQFCITRDRANQFGFGLNSSGNIIFNVRDNGGSYNFYTGSGTVALSTWTHIVGILDGSNWIVYINGVQDNTGTHNDGIYDGGTVTFGVGGIATLDSFDGLIYQPFIFDRALTTEEINNIMDYGINGKNGDN